jgi:hypothetical protein
MLGRLRVIADERIDAYFSLSDWTASSRGRDTERRLLARSEDDSIRVNWSGE